MKMLKYIIEFMINIPIIIHKSYIGYFKFYYTLLDFTKVVISSHFNVTIYIEFEHLNY
jgi:hypothetical protein